MIWVAPLRGSTSAAYAAYVGSDTRWLLLIKQFSSHVVALPERYSPAASKTNERVKQYLSIFCCYY